MTRPDIIPWLADQISPILASPDALETLADEIELAKLNTTPENISRHARRPITNQIVKLAIEMLVIRAKSMRDARSEAPDAPSEDPL